jgi:hypothetical protein
VKAKGGAPHPSELLFLGRTIRYSRRPPLSRFLEVRSSPWRRPLLSWVVRRREVNVATELEDDAKRIDEWLAILGGRGARPQGPEGRKRAVAEMCAAGADRLFPLLVPRLTGPDPETRCAACEAILRIDARRAIEFVLPLLDDSEVVVRWNACGCLHDFGDERAVLPLIRVLQSDPDAMTRGTAAYALGGIRSPAAIPALLAAMESDHEWDELGHSASSSAATALDNILGTHETRIRLPDGLCKMAEYPPDLERLKQIARKTYADWSKSQTEPGAAADGGRDPGS